MVRPPPPPANGGVWGTPPTSFFQSSYQPLGFGRCKNRSENFLSYSKDELNGEPEMVADPLSWGSEKGGRDVSQGNHQ